MERSSKLAQLTLVSKYFPVANYSYPRCEGAPTPYNSRRSSNESDNKRASLGSQASPLSPPPGLIDDRTDSEASADDDDYRYHAHADELWDSFWISGHHYYHSSYRKRAAAMAVAGPVSVAVSCIPPMVPEKDYPALIPSPQRLRGHRCQGSQAWPLSDHHQSNQPRKSSPTYSAFPKIVTIPSRTCTRQSSSSQLSTSPCEDSISPTDVRCPPQQTTPSRPATSHHRRTGSPHPRAFSPASLKAFQRPATSHGSRPTSPMDYPYPSPPPTAPLPALPPICSGAPCSPTRLTPRSSNLSQLEPNQQSQPQLHYPTQPPPQTIRPYKSTTQLRPQRPPPEPLPVSVFEYDTDSDCDDDDSDSSSESLTLSFFRFHRRSQSPNSNEGVPTRRRGSASKTASVIIQKPVVEAATVAKERRRQRKRTNTMESLKQSDVFNKWLGRRSSK